MRLATRNIIGSFILILCGLSAAAQPGAWNSPFKSPLPASVFKNFGVCISYQTDSFVYFAVAQNTTPNNLDIYEFNGDSLHLVFHDTSGTLGISSNYQLIKYKGAFYITTVLYEYAGTSDTAGHFYKWTGSAWKPLINSIYFDKTGPGIISAIEYNGDLYLGGGFDSINGVNLNHVVKYDGSNFLPVVFGGYTGVSHYGYIGLANDTFGLFGDGDYSAFRNGAWLWRNKSMAFYFYESFMFNGRLNFISLQTGNIIALKGSSMVQSGMSVPSESVTGKRSGLVVHNGNLYGYLDSVYKISGIDHSKPNGLFVHNQKTKWNSIATSIVTQNGVYDYYASTKLFSFKNKLYAYGHIDTVNAKGEVLRFLAVFGSPMKKVKGRVYEDTDSNCRYSAGEKSLRGRIVEALPGPYYCSTNDSGIYSFELPFATYRISLVPKNYWKTNKCDSGCTITIKDTSRIDTLDFGQRQRQINDVAVSLTGNSGYRARRGFSECYHISVTNVGYQTQTTKLSLTFPNGLANFSAIPNPTSQSGNTAEWQLNNILEGDLREISFCLTVDTANFHLGDKIIFTANITTPSDDSSAVNNQDTLRQKVVSSLDPNDKQIYPFTNDSITLLAPGSTELEYTIHFENLGNDTAYKVVVLDTISVNLDVKQIEQTGISHNGVLDVLPCLPELGRCILRWTFNNINLPPRPLGTDSVFTNNRGHVSYKITTLNSLPLGTSIYNHADIYFDFNSSVTTNTVLVKVDTSTLINGFIQSINSSTLTIFPNPFSEVLYINNAGVGKQIVWITDIAGKELLKETIHASGVTSLPISGLLPGIYFLRTGEMGQAMKIIKY